MSTTKVKKKKASSLTLQLIQNLNWIMLLYLDEVDTLDDIDIDDDVNTELEVDTRRGKKSHKYITM